MNSKNEEFYKEIKTFYENLLDFKEGAPMFDKVYCICMADMPHKQERLLQQLKYFYPSLEPIVFEAISSRHLKNHHIGCALSHRAVIQEAKNNNYKNILVFEEDAQLHKNFAVLLNKNFEELKKINWDIFYLGACCGNRHFEKVKECETLEEITASTCTHGLVYNNTIYDYILDNVPDNFKQMKKWTEINVAIDQWLARYIQDREATLEEGRKPYAVMATPRICTQPFLPKNGHDSKKDFHDCSSDVLYWPRAGVLRQYPFYAAPL